MPILPYKGIWPVIAENVFIAPGAMVVGNVTIREGASVWYNAVVRGDVAPIVIGRRTNIQDNCTLHVDEDAPLTIGDDCTVGHGAIVHGATVGDRVLVGMNSVVLSHAQVGADTIVGASALVSEGKSVASGSLAVGIPARAVRALTEVERAHILESAAGYVQRAQAHKESLRELQIQER
ncbi:MAG TPA: gamma carbonic anhydrase family protein [Ktedonobacteraceae bacterium]|nr:gamma carbonic anhydrase family protein [Ktedonobacteraceae bacterium]